MASAPASASPPIALTEFELGVIDIFVHLADLVGVPRSVGEIYGLLFASARPLAFQDIVDRLRISKGSASQGLRMLKATGAAQRVYVGGDRRDHFVPETELRALLSGFLREKVRPHMEDGLARLESLRGLAQAESFPGSDPGEVRALRQRIDKLHTWHRRARAVVPVISKLFG